MCYGPRRWADTYTTSNVSAFPSSRGVVVAVDVGVVVGVVTIDSVRMVVFVVALNLPVPSLVVVVTVVQPSARAQSTRALPEPSSRSEPEPDPGPELESGRAGAAGARRERTSSIRAPHRIRITGPRRLGGNSCDGGCIDNRQLE